MLTGPEYASILDGRTGKEITRVDWIARGKVSDWGDNSGNRASRHMIGVAYLSGDKPSLIAHRGTLSRSAGRHRHLRRFFSGSPSK